MVTQTWHISILDEDSVDTLYEEDFTGTLLEAQAQAKFILREAKADRIPGVPSYLVGTAVFY